MTKQTFTQKSNGDTLSATEWNTLTGYVNEAVDAINSGSGGATIEGGVIDTSGMVSVSSKGNTTISSVKNINLEPAWDNNVSNYTGNYGDIAFKPGDDIQFASHHREPKKRDKIVIKNVDGSDNPVKLQTVAGEIELAVGTKNNPKTATKKKDKDTGNDTSEAMFKADDAKVLDVKVLTGSVLDEGTNNERDERAYLKVRAQAIDLRCEKHGGVALQPKGYDSDGNMNKIKFEHGGGDGLEFGTFNTEKSSLYTDEYRFKKDGVWKMATRETTPNTKAIYDDNTPSGKQSTAALKYVKQSDDFYDKIDVNDETATTKSIIKTAYALNDGKNRHAKYEEKVTTKGELKKTLEIETVVTISFEPVYTINKSYTQTPLDTDFIELSEEVLLPNKTVYTIQDIIDIFGSVVINNTLDSEKILSYQTDAFTLLSPATVEPGQQQSTVVYTIQMSTGVATLELPAEVSDVDKIYTISDFKDAIKTVTVNEVAQKYGISGEDGVTLSAGDIVSSGDYDFKIVENFSPSMDITSGADLSVKAKEGTLSLGGKIVEFGSDTIDLGEMEDGLYAQYKLTKKNNSKPCDTLKIKVINNQASPLAFDADSANFAIESFYPTETVTVPAKVAEPTTDAEANQHIVTVAQCKLYDVIKFVAWAKNNNFGPWGNS